MWSGITSAVFCLVVCKRRESCKAAGEKSHIYQTSIVCIEDNIPISVILDEDSLPVSVTGVNHGYKQYETPRYGRIRSVVPR